MVVSGILLGRSNDQSTKSTIIYHLILLCSYPLHPARGFILIYDNHSHWLVLSVYGLHRKFYSRILPFQKYMIYPKIKRLYQLKLIGLGISVCYYQRTGFWVVIDVWLVSAITMLYGYISI
ncbi:hypothetical protein BDB01DRAFT_901189 [Pilobolus umbonatus]|nr:hypothetical protein BDB01DRAFT_901189 [Pilobolus umbonatus]